MKRIFYPLFTLSLIFVLPLPKVSAETESSSVLADLDTTLTLGYESRYVLYGYRLSRHLYTADLSFYLPVNDRTAAWAGAWYGYLTDGTYHELDGYAGLDYYLSDHWTAGAGYSIFNYIEVPFPTSGQAHELTAYLTASAGPFSLTLQDHYDSEAEGHLLRGILNATVPAGERLAIRASVEYGYAVEYFIEGDAWNHALYKLDASYEVNHRVGLNAFIARTIALEAIDDFEEDDTYGGVSVSLRL